VLILANNRITKLEQLAPLQAWKNVEMLSLLGNPVTTEKNYRLKLIRWIPNLRILDFKRIKQEVKMRTKDDEL